MQKAHATEYNMYICVKYIMSKITGYINMNWRCSGK